MDDLSNDYDSYNTSFVSRLPYLFNIDGSIDRAVQARIIPLKASMDQIAALQLHHIMYDTTGRDLGDYRDWLDKAKCYEADVCMATSLAKDEDWTGAESQLDDMISKYGLVDEFLDEHENYQAVIEIIEGAQDNSRSMYSLNATEQHELDSIRKISFGLARLTTTNILALYDTIIPLSFLLPGQSIQERSVGNQAKKLSEKQSTSFALKPNPAKGEVELIWSPFEDMSSDILIYDTNGRNALKAKTNLAIGRTLIDVSKLPPGIYYLLLLCEKDVVTQQCFLKQ